MVHKHSVGLVTLGMGLGFILVWVWKKLGEVYEEWEWNRGSSYNDQDGHRIQIADFQSMRD